MTLKKEKYDKDYYNRGIIGKGLEDILIRLANLGVLRGVKDGARILDLGCGQGLWLEYLRKKGFDGWGLDTSRAAIGEAVKRLGKKKLIVGELERVGFKKNFFDAVTCFHVLEHVKKADSLVKEVFGILKKDGLFVLRLPDFSSWEVKLAGERWFHGDALYHVKNYDKKSVVKLLKKAGFEQIEVKPALFEYRQTLLYSLINFCGVEKISRFWRFLLLPLQLFFAPLSFFLAVVFANSGTMEVRALRG
ncbi:class I SAM-dependent methyltransferase [Patescibacteria group bacterium]|nr:class I SAM-dependent methyltransferase [Patescibacteria group bacterium]MBU4265128.1 class I SAM-dependent methyltransferase [Patescibacteria group bacterium]MBU4390692.1 class I SAM-dependent methyltransferase [Patescibacteria group bacterium]MBU4397526.1 class I SAM-dependent methyltransferase [Patescibacteria group bacterium]MBU4430968.1 class I SAM-dependent methyltransferase [Patescibacteria group bacterium]